MHSNVSLKLPKLQNCYCTTVNSYRNYTTLLNKSKTNTQVLWTYNATL